MTVKKWDDKGVQQAVQRHIKRNMKQAMLLLQGKVQRKISTGQPVVRIGKSLRGLNPSAPGQPPHVLSGNLRKSITHEVDIQSGAIIGRVGSNIEYARRLELGFQGADSAGRNVNQEARPYLRPSLRENLTAVINRVFAE